MSPPSLSSLSPSCPKPLFRTLVQLEPPPPRTRDSALLFGKRTALPKHVHVTGWGTPLEESSRVVFYFGGMPASAEEPALHSLLWKGGDNTAPTDLYRARHTTLLYLDKPGMGQTPFSYNFRIRRDWPVMVDQVARHFGIGPSQQDNAVVDDNPPNTDRPPHCHHEKYGIMGVSNGGPYVMACLTHPQTAPHIAAASMIVGVSDVWASGYFSLRKHPSGFGEGLYNSLPILFTGPLNYCMFGVAAPFYLLRGGGFDKVFNATDFPALSDNNNPARARDTKAVLCRVLEDSVRTCGLGSAVDCQQGLSPLYALDRKSVEQLYGQIQTPVSLWYGTRDSTVPMSTAVWLSELLPSSRLYTQNCGHGLYLYHAAEVLDDLVHNMEAQQSS